MPPHTDKERTSHNPDAQGGEVLRNGPGLLKIWSEGGREGWGRRLAGVQRIIIIPTEKEEEKLIEKNREECERRKLIKMRVHP